MTLRVVFAGTPDFAAEALSALLNSEHQVIAVYTQPDRPAGRGRALKPSAVKHMALEYQKYQIPVYQPARLKDPSEQQILRDLNPDVLIVAAYGLILPAAVLTIPRLGCINIHGSLLPRWRGAAPIQHALLANDKITGITIMQMDVGLDTGDILSLHPYTIQSTDTSQDLHDTLAKLGAGALIGTLQKLEKGQIIPQKQDPTLATYASKISKDDANLNWQESASNLACKIRAFNPWPVAFTHLDSQIIRIWNAKLVSIEQNNSNAMTPGTILSSNKDGIMVATGQGVLQLLEIQLPSSKRLPVAEILKSKNALFAAGARFTAS